MQVEWHVLRFERGENGSKFRLVQIFAKAVRVDDHAVERQILPSAFDLRDRCLRVLRRYRRQPCKARGMGANDRGKAIVQGTGDARAFLWREACGPGIVMLNRCISTPFASISARRASTLHSLRLSSDAPAPVPLRKRAV